MPSTLGTGTSMPDQTIDSAATTSTGGRASHAVATSRTTRDIRFRFTLQTTLPEFAGFKPTRPERRRMKLLITGAANGIGQALAEAFEKDGATVFRVDKEPCQYQVDLSQSAAIEELVASLDGPLDGLINNAGVMVRKPPEQLTVEEWNRVIATNLTAPFLLTRGLAPQLRAGRGRVINIASTRALMSEPNTEAYAASKGGLVALTHCLAVSLGPEITVNCISPGWIDTQAAELSPEDHAQHPAGRVGRPADIVGLVRYLLSDEASFVTGANFVIDGGMTRKMIYVP